MRAEGRKRVKDCMKEREEVNDGGREGGRE